MVTSVAHYPIGLLAHHLYHRDLRAAEDRIRHGYGFTAAVTDYNRLSADHAQLTHSVGTHVVTDLRPLTRRT